MRPRRPKGSDEPVAIGDSLRAVSRDLGMAEPDALARLLGAWPGLVGEAVAEHAEPRSLLDGVLTIAVDDPAWATELRYLETELRRRCDDLVEPGLVRGTRVVVARSKPGRRGAGLVD